MSETRSHTSEDNILHIAEVAKRRRKRGVAWTVLIALLVMLVLVGLADVLVRLVGYFGRAQAALLAAPQESTIRVPQPDMPPPAEPVDVSVSYDPGIPVRMNILSIGVAAAVQPVGVTAAGYMQAPKRFSDVGWYRGGSKPGEAGSAVFGGHVNNALTTAGVFERLEELRPGDHITVSDASGEKLVFEVTATETYSADNAPLEEIFSRAGPPRLVLITCDGKWDSVERDYTHRLIVYASLDT